MTELACLSVPACRMPVAQFERLAVRRDDLDELLPRLRAATGASQALLVSTCERVELYAWWPHRAAPELLPHVLASERGLSLSAVSRSGSLYVGDAAVAHLLRVAAGLESFVLGESDIVGQVRSAGAAAHDSGVAGLELERLVDSAVHTSRRVHRETALGKGGRSVASAAVWLAHKTLGDSLTDRSVVVVGAGHVAGAVVSAAGARGARVTVCNRTRRHADRLAGAGATVVDLGRLHETVRDADVLIFGTGAPEPLLDVHTVTTARRAVAGELLVLDLCVPRNVDPAVRDVPGVLLRDLDDLRSVGSPASEELAAEVHRAEEIIAEELARYRRWLAGRAAAKSVRAWRSALESIGDQELERLTADLAPDEQRLVEEGMRRVVRRIAHHPTRALLAAAEAGETGLMDALADALAGPGPLTSGSPPRHERQLNDR